MAAGKLVFRFTSTVVRVRSFHVLPVPDTAAAAWKQARVRRLVGTVNGVAVKRALMSHADGGSFVIINRAFMRQAGLGLQTPAALEFRPDPAPNRLDMPKEFRLALDQDPAARARWATFTLGLQRSLVSYVTGAKTEPTRIRRAVELATKISQRRLYGDRQKTRVPTRPGRAD